MTNRFLWVRSPILADDYLIFAYRQLFTAHSFCFRLAQAAEQNDAV